MMSQRFLNCLLCFFLLFIIGILSPTPLAEAYPAAETYSVAHYNPTNYLQINLPKVTGPESVVFDCQGRGPYVGVSDGRILKWQGSHLGWTEFAFPKPYRPRYLCDGSTNPTFEPICGRPLGLKFNPTTCELYIADAYFGLLKTGPNGGLAQKVADFVGRVPFRFLNGLDIDTETGIVYFTDSSTIYQRRDWSSIIYSGDKTGKLLQYNPWTNMVTVLFQGLGFANGVALSQDNSFVLVIEGATNKIHKFWVRGPKTHTIELFYQLERAADNIKRNHQGEFWIALNGEVPEASTIPWLTKNPIAVKFDEEGHILKVLEGNGDAKLQSISHVEEHYGRLWIGSVANAYVGVWKV